MRIRQGETGCRGNGVFLNQELLAIVEGRYGDGPQRAIWYEDECLDLEFVEGWFKRFEQQRVQGLRMGKILVRGSFF